MTTRNILAILIAGAVPLMLAGRPANRAGGNGGRNRPAMQRGQVGQKMLARFDTNDDHSVSKSEFVSGFTDIFNKEDANSDGVVTKDEAEKSRQAFGDAAKGKMKDASAARFKEADKNSDGVLSKDEWPGRPEGFGKVDADINGSVTLDEFQAGLKKMGEAMKERGEKSGAREELWKRADANSDGKVSLDEWTTAITNLFAKLDRNGDGQLNAADHPTAGPGGGNRATGHGGHPKSNTPPANPKKPDLP
ncbi:MAG: hypothetical protein ACREJQ_02850 [bacterium]